MKLWKLSVLAAIIITGMGKESIRPTVLGILNLTDDSFSDGGAYATLETALVHARQLLADGADLIDVGAEATHPRAEAVSEEEEMARLTPVVTELKKIEARVSVDTTKPGVMRRMLALGADVINDVTGFLNPESVAAVRDSTAKIIVMHAVHTLTAEQLPVTPRAEPLSYSPPGIVARIENFFRERISTLMAAGIAKERIILDPGMGVFLGNNPRASFQVLIHLPKFRKLGVPLCVCTSRKSFLTSVLHGPPRPPRERGAATLATELIAFDQGAQYIRTHDVRALCDALAIWDALDRRHDAAAV